MRGLLYDPGTDTLTLRKLCQLWMTWLDIFISMPSLLGYFIFQCCFLYGISLCASVFSSLATAMLFLSIIIYRNVRSMIGCRKKKKKNTHKQTSISIILPSGGGGGCGLCRAVLISADSCPVVEERKTMTYEYKRYIMITKFSQFDI